MTRSPALEWSTDNCSVARTLEVIGEKWTLVVLRELFLGESARRLTNYRHLFEVLAADAARTARPLADVVRRLSALCEGLLVPAPEEGNVQRLESERRAVQIMTIHKAKGLEASVVFVVGGLSSASDREARVYHEGGRRLAWVGPPSGAVKLRIAAEEREEDQRDDRGAGVAGADPADRDHQLHRLRPPVEQGTRRPRELGGAARRLVLRADDPGGQRHARRPRHAQGPAVGRQPAGGGRSGPALLCRGGGCHRRRVSARIALRGRHDPLTGLVNPPQCGAQPTLTHLCQGW